MDCGKDVCFCVLSAKIRKDESVMQSIVKTILELSTEKVREIIYTATQIGDS